MVKLEQLLNKEISTLVKSVPKIDTAEKRHGHKITFQQFLDDKILIILVIQMGVTYSLFDLIRTKSPFSEPDWAEFLDISTRSLHRYKQAPKRFKPLQSEKIIEIAEVANVGEEVFGDMGKFRRWLETPNFSLGKFRPMDLLKDSYGKEMIIGELTRISHGVLA